MSPSPPAKTSRSPASNVRSRGIKSPVSESILSILADLTGQDAPFKKDLERAAKSLLAKSGLGYSQFNELLLLLGYDRITPSFFQYLVDGTTDYMNGAGFESVGRLRVGVDRFRVLAILFYGNVKFGFKELSAPAMDLDNVVARVGPVDLKEFRGRHDALSPVDPIPGDQTYYLGYLIKRQLDDRLRRNPADGEAKAQLKDREKIVEKGKRNHEAYLASDHMDVYVATSMRERHEYQAINGVVADVFRQKALRSLKVRWFDPTQAYCEERIDKGLAEALMLKRAACTLYLAQESDTLGKDSELASTLAQGKPVIAYIPSVTRTTQKRYVNDLLKMVLTGSPRTSRREAILQQLRVFHPEAAWQDDQVMRWVADPARMDLETATGKLGDCIRKHYDKRAQTLKESHPLGIQVFLQTGVANGVLVARTTRQCANLIRNILTHSLEFTICEQLTEGNRYLLLKEKTTESIFRVVTGDRFLTNAFWNFYLAK